MWPALHLWQMPSPLRSHRPQSTSVVVIFVSSETGFPPASAFHVCDYRFVSSCLALSAVTGADDGLQAAHLHRGPGSCLVCGINDKSLPCLVAEVNVPLGAEGGKLWTEAVF